VSRTGKTAIRRTLGESFAEGYLEDGGMGGWFGIECPLINFSSLDHADFEKFHEKIDLVINSPFANQADP
jgi:hypothetical protein